jgi:hypothetical protein
VTGVLIQNHEGEQQIWSIIQDITERRRVEQMKNQFVSMVSHELRTPLTAISGALGLLSGGALGALPEAMQPMLQIAGDNSEKLTQLINDLLDIDKLLWINSNGLTTSQRAKLAKTHPLSKEEVNDYQQNTVSPFTKVVQVSPTHKIVLKVPTINEYIAAGEEWLASMTEAATKIFTGDDNEENVRRYVKRVIDMSGLREYSHWIERIIFDDIDEVEGDMEVADTLKMNRIRTAKNLKFI